MLPRGFVWAQKGTGSDKQLIIRTESPLNGEPDPEHERIDVTVYPGAESGAVRVITDDV